MYIPNITVHINGSSCPTCHLTTPCGCSQGQTANHLPAPATPCNNETCEDPTGFSCVLYDGEDNEQLGIKKGDNLTKVVNLLLQRIVNLES